MSRFAVLVVLVLVALQVVHSLKCNSCGLEETCNKSPVTCPELSAFQKQNKLRQACVTVTGKVGAKTVMQAKKCDVDKWAVGEDSCVAIKKDVSGQARQIQDVKCSMCYTDNCN